MLDAQLWLITLMWSDLVYGIGGILALILTIEVISRVKDWFR